MPKLKLRTIPDDKPVKLTASCPPPSIAILSPIATRSAAKPAREPSSRRSWSVRCWRGSWRLTAPLQNCGGRHQRRSGRALGNRYRNRRRETATVQATPSDRLAALAGSGGDSGGPSGSVCAGSPMLRQQPVPRSEPARTSAIASLAYPVEFAPADQRPRHGTKVQTVTTVSKVGRPSVAT
jgi:hypothetical protein